MSEVPPKMPPVESKESAERPLLYKILEHEVLEVQEDGAEKVRELECNGLRHRECVDIRTYNAAGDIVYVEEISQADLGPCDGKHS